MEKMLQWLNKEVEKDKAEVERYKQNIAQQMKGLKRDELFIKKKITFWDKIKIILWGK